MCWRFIQPDGHTSPLCYRISDTHPNWAVQVDRHECLSPMVITTLTQVPSPKKLAAHHQSPTLSIPLPSGPGFAISVDCFGSLPTPPRGNASILPFTDSFIRRVGIHLLTDAQFSRKGRPTLVQSACLFRATRSASCRIAASNFASKICVAIPQAMSNAQYHDEMQTPQRQLWR